MYEIFEKLIFNQTRSEYSLNSFAKRLKCSCMVHDNTQNLNDLHGISKTEMLFKRNFRKSCVSD